MQPHGRMDWTVGDWIAQADQIDRRCSSRHRYAAAERHIEDFPLADVSIELDPRASSRRCERFSATPQASSGVRTAAGAAITGRRRRSSP